MPLTLLQYADYLDTRDLPWPAAPEGKRPKAKPHLARLPKVRLVTWNLYGTLLTISGGELFFEHPQKFVMELALEKTVQEFKMWGAMSRKPGKPSEYMGQLYTKALDEQRLAPSPGEKHPEIVSERVWDWIIKKLFQKEYQFDAGFYGSLNEYCKKVAYFFHASLQGAACQPSALAAVAHVAGCGVPQGLIADAQCFTLAQLQRGMRAQGGGAVPLPAGRGLDSTDVDVLFPAEWRALSCEHKGRKPSERLFRPVLAQAAKAGLAPENILHIGSRIDKDIAPAKKLGLRTALYAGDKESLQASVEQLKDPGLRPDVLLTELEQIKTVVTPL
ncbi:MAG: HAD hydrolase-like protein [Gemmataceae bacterium]|nr:HAD hydrolase-like protein [Gemmataceae bacterium]